MNRDFLRALGALALSALLLPVGCSSPSYTSTGNGGSGTGTGTGNVATISVNGGPFVSNVPYPNAAFTSVTVCVPGSTTQCQTISGILVDTGSYGLRIEASALNGLGLTQQMSTSNNPVVECAQFGSGFTWGPVQTADFTIAGETATSIPIQVIGSSSYPDTDLGGAATCAGGEAGSQYDYNTAENLGANGILGIGNFAQDCGTGCTVTSNNEGFYYSCPTASSCSVTTEALASQVVNPVTMFATDNNGVIVELNSVSGGEAATSSGSLIFGIGTESNNGLGNATIYDVDTTYGNLTVEFNGQSYYDYGFMDSGSNALYFSDPTYSGLLECTDTGYTYLYCPANNVSLTATNEGYSNGNSGQVNFIVGNGEALASSSDLALGYLGGLGETSGGDLYFDWGLPFFYGTNVYYAIDGATTPGGTGPYVAY